MIHAQMKISERQLEEMAAQHVRRDRSVNDVDRMWALFVEAVNSERFLKNPPWLAGSTRSAMPDSPDLVSQWEVLSAYLRGETEEIPEVKTTLQPTAAQMTRHDLVMAVWHASALRGRGDWKRLRKALWMYAKGRPNREVRRKFDLTKMGLSRLKHGAMQDMLRQVQKKTCY